MKWKQIACLIEFGLLGAASCCIFGVPGITIGIILGVYVGLNSKEYKAASKYYQPLKK